MENDLDAPENTIITHNILYEAIKASGIDEKAAKDMAQFAINFFGYSDRLLDNILNPEDRDIFYMLEDAGLLMTEREETLLYDGKDWRIHYWVLRKLKILELAATYDKQEESKPADVYSKLPDDVWIRNAALA